MNLLGIIEEIDKADPEFQDRISPRRDAIKNITDKHYQHLLSRR